MSNSSNPIESPLVEQPQLDSTRHPALPNVTIGMIPNQPPSDGDKTNSFGSPRENDNEGSLPSAPVSFGNDTTTTTNGRGPQHHTDPSYSNASTYPANSYPYQPPPPIPSRSLQFRQGAQQQTTLTTNSYGTGPLVTAVVVGSMLGLTAAAAVRWLNGGDFDLFPPPNESSTTATSTTTRQQSATAVENTGTESMIPGTTVMNGVPHLLHQRQECDTDGLAAALSDQHQNTLLQKLEEVVTRQQKMEETIDFANRSMELLQQQQQGMPPSTDESRIVESLSAIQRELREIRELLAHPGNNSSDQENDGKLRSHLSTVLDKLDATMGNESALDDEQVVETSENQNVQHVSTKAAKEALRVKAVHLNPASLAVSRSIVNNGSLETNRKDTTASTGSLRDAICQLILENDSNQLVSGAQLLYLYVVNVASHPRLPRYRKIHCNNESYQHHVAPLRGANELLRAVGFVEQKQPQNQISQFQRNQASFWEWLPPDTLVPDAEQNFDMPGAGNDAAENATAVSPSDALQKPWFDNSEAAYLDRLREATAALAVLKVRTTSTKQELVQEALSSSGLDVLRTPTPYGMCTSDNVSPTKASWVVSSALTTSDVVTSNGRNRDSGAIATPIDVNTPHRKTGATKLDNDATLTTPDRAIDTSTQNAYSTSNGAKSCAQTVADAAMFQTPTSGSILSPPVTKSITSLDGDFPLALLPNADLPLESKSSPETTAPPPPPPLLVPTPPQNQASEVTLPESDEKKLDHVESVENGLADEAEAALWK